MPGPMSAPNGNAFLTLHKRSGGEHTGKTAVQRAKGKTQAPGKPKPIRDRDDLDPTREP